MGKIEPEEAKKALETVQLFCFQHKVCNREEDCELYRWCKFSLNYRGNKPEDWRI